MPNTNTATQPELSSRKSVRLHYLAQVKNSPVGLCAGEFLVLCD